MCRSNFPEISTNPQNISALFLWHMFDFIILSVTIAENSRQILLEFNVCMKKINSFLGEHGKYTISLFCNLVLFGRAKTVEFL